MDYAMCQNGRIYDSFRIVGAGRLANTVPVSCGIFLRTGAGLLCCNGKRVKSVLRVERTVNVQYTQYARRMSFLIETRFFFKRQHWKLTFTTSSKSICYMLFCALLPFFWTPWLCISPPRNTVSQANSSSARLISHLPFLFLQVGSWRKQGHVEVGVVLCKYGGTVPSLSSISCM